MSQINKRLKSKSGDWLLKKPEDALKKFLLPKIPRFVETYHLTWLTLLWSCLVILMFALGRVDETYLYYIPILVFLQYITDLLDGAIGRHRDTGLIKWGYYVDHFLDFTFMTAIVYGYSLLLGLSTSLFLLYAIISGFMVSTFLLVNSGKAFKISFLRIGPTEGRVIFALIHILFIYLGIETVNLILPYFVGLTALVMTSLFIINQEKLWQEDMQLKHNKK